MRRISGLAAALMFMALAFAAQAMGSGITNSGDDLRTGWYPNNSTLTPQLVGGGTFGEEWSTSLEGQITAQPLLDNGTLLVETENDKAYGLDPATGAVNWTRGFGTPWNPADIGCGDITPSIGTVSTPVIDTATNIAYMTDKRYVSGSSGPAVWYMDAVSVATGVEQPGFPAEIAGSAQNAPSQTFDPTIEMNRPGLLLMEGVVYAAFGSHCDFGPWKGWIFGVSTAGKITARYTDNATETGAGIWQSGAGLTSDGPGTILFSTGNGGAPSKPAPGTSPPVNLGESVVRVRVQEDGSLKAVDFFAPVEASELDKNDADFASGGVTGLPDEFFGTPSLPHLAIADGKSGYVYLLNRDALGGIAQGPSGSDNVIQRLGPRGGVWSRPGIWPGEGGYVYIPTSTDSTGGGHLDVYKYGLSASGQPNLSLAGSSEDVFGWGSGAPVITSNGTTPGSALVWIVWSADRTGSGGQLRAYEPVPVNGKPVLRFEMPIGKATNYSMPGVGEGRVYVGNREGTVTAFGSPVAQPLSGSPTEFPTTTLGKSSQKTVTLTANENLTVTGLSSDSSQFTAGASSPGLPATLTAGQTISIPVTFIPTKTGPVSASLSATTGSGTTKFSLSGTGQAKGPELQVAPTFLSFQGVVVGGQHSESVTLTNVGSAPLTITEFVLPNTQGPFKVTGLPHENWRMEPGEEIPLTVSFEPTHEGTFPGEMVVKTTANEGRVGLSGEAGSPAVLHYSEEAIQYGSVVLGSAATRSFTITNVGGTPATINKSKPPIGGAFTAETQLSEGTTIQAGASVTESVKFTPTGTASATGTWQITADDGTGLRQITFSGEGALTTPATSGGVLALPGVLSTRSRQAPIVPDAELLTLLLRAHPDGSVNVRVRCGGTSSICKGTILLETRAGRTASGRVVRGARAVIFARGKFTIRHGKAATIRLHLSSATMALLARTGVLRLRAVIAAHDSGGAAHTAHPNVTVLRAR